MKKILYACVALILTLTGLHAFAAADGTDVTGIWTGEMKSDSGSFELTFTFKQEGTKITGTVQGPGGDPLVITDGSIDGQKISFKVTYNGTVYADEGSVAGDEMTLHTRSGQGDFSDAGITLKRSETAKAPAASQLSAVR